MDKLRVSKSLILDWWKYKDGELCGELFNKRYIERAELEEITSDAMLAGQRFEYQTINSTLRGGVIPPIVTTSTGKPAAIQNIVDVQTDRFLKFMKENGIELVSSGVKLEVDMDKYILVGVVDGFLNIDGQLSILEMKFTSMLNPVGWGKDSPYAYFTDRLKDNRIHMLQPRLYVLICKTHPDYGQALPFYYYIASSKMMYSAECVEVPVQDSSIETLLTEIDEIVNDIEATVNLGLEFNALPEATRCSKCPAKAICNKKVDSVTIKRISHEN